MDRPELGTQEQDAAEASPDAPVLSSLAELASAVREVGPSPRQVRPASFGPRFWATFIDAAVLMLLSLLFVLVEVGMGVVRILPERGEAVVACGYLLFVLLLTATEAFGSATPGKSFVGLRVVRRDGRTATTGRRVCRWAVKQSPLVCFAGTLSLLMVSEMGMPLPDGLWLPLGFAIQGLSLIIAAGCLLVLMPSRRALHDLLTGTAVYREEDVVREAGHAFRPLPLQVSGAGAAEDAVTASA